VYKTKNCSAKIHLFIFIFEQLSRLALKELFYQKNIDENFHNIPRLLFYPVFFTYGNSFHLVAILAGNVTEYN